MRRKYVLILSLLVLALLKPSGTASATSVWPLLLELSAAPGTETTGSIRLHNESATESAYVLSVRDFSASTDESGTPVFSRTEPANDTRSMATWIRLNNGGVVLSAGESREVHFTVQVPLDAHPGDYRAALLFGATAPNEDVSINTEIGSLVFLNVTGEAKTEGTLLSFSAPHFATHLPEVFSTRFGNSGDTVFAPTGSITIVNVLGQERTQINLNPDNGRVLQSSVRNFVTTWQKAEVPDGTPEIVREWKNFGLGPYQAILTASVPGTEQPFTAKTIFWIIPYQLITIAAALVFFIVLTAKHVRFKKMP